MARPVVQTDGAPTTALRVIITTTDDTIIGDAQCVARTPASHKAGVAILHLGDVDAHASGSIR